MPFNRYIEDNDYTYDYPSHASTSSSPRSYVSNSAQVRLQIPQFMSTGAPMLAPGGGAEILPVGFFSNGSSTGLASTWYANNGLTGGFQQQSLTISQGPSKMYMPQQSSFSQSNAPVPVHYIRHPSDLANPTSAAASVSSTFDFDNSSTNNSDSKDSSQMGMYGNSGFVNSQQYPSPLNAISAPPASPSFGVNLPSTLGLPIYSTTGFDLLSVLARVATRPNPQVALGPVDFTSSFAVVDVRRYDHPIIYCSPTFCRLTGYEEHEILGKNCRFLQSPDGNQPKGEIRKYTSQEAVSHIKKNLVADKEVQTSIVNYRKNGQAFINLVTIIPIRSGDIGMPSEDDKVVYHVGFQVDLNTQPHDIMQKVKDGSYIPNYTANDPVAIVPPSSSSAGSGALHGLVSRDRKLHTLPVPVMSQTLKKLMEDRNFMGSFPVTTNTNSDSNTAQSIPCSTASATATSPTSPMSASPSGSLDATSSTSSTSPLTSSSSDLVNVGPMVNHPLSLILLEYSPDFIHVVSLKGSFLYVAPSVKRILGYHPVELVGRSLSDICHPADVIPLMRELKESSATGPMALGSAGNAGVSGGDDPKYYSNKPRPVDLLFRARTKDGKYVWVECRGRLHVEPGKGRKAIMLSGRAKEMSNLKWSAVASAGGLSRPRLGRGNDTLSFSSSPKDSTPPSTSNSPGLHEKVTEFWGTITRAGTLLVVGSGCKDVLGWDELELIGKPIWNFLVEDDKKRRVSEELVSMGCGVGTADAPGSLPSKVHCRMVQHNQSHTNVELVLYPSSIHSDVLASVHTISPAPIIYQIKLYDPSNMTVGASTLVHPLDENIFKELETSRNSSWQYELQQLKFANDRLKEEIRNLEGENGSTSSSQVLAMQQSQKQQEMVASGLVNQHTRSPRMQRLSLPTGPGSLTGPLGGNYDHQQHHQGIGSGSFNSADHPSVTSSHTLYNTIPYSHAQPSQGWSANVNVNPLPGVSTAVSMQMQFVSPQQQQQLMRYNNSSSTGYPGTSSQLKRSWDSVDRGGPV